jgi:GTP-binding protein
MRREKYIPKGGPDGGDGGRGGHVILRGNEQMWTLLHLKYRKHIKAGNGDPGSGNQKSGKQGEDVYIDVPLGTVARDAETGEIICEITHHGEEHIVMRGGKGGLGNVHFKSPTNQAPDYAQPGGEHEEGWVILELKIMADVGLVGFPNAGKSTLLATVSAAKPEIADYAFTTLVPNLGIVPYRGSRSFVMADIPGIIEGAHEGKGLGLRFLRHIERNSVLLFMVPADAPSIREQYQTLLHELQSYNPKLMEKERLLAISKCDLIDEVMMEQMKADLPENVPYTFISSVSQLGILELKDKIWRAINS